MTLVDPGHESAAKAYLSTWKVTRHSVSSAPPLTTHTFFIIFSNVSNVKSFLIFSRKTSQAETTEKTFQKKILFDTHSTGNLAALSFFRRNPTFFWKNSIFWMFWEIFLFSSHSIANMLNSGQNSPRWVEDFAPIIYIVWRKIQTVITWSFHLLLQLRHSIWYV